MGSCPVTEDISERLLRLPFYTDLAEADQLYVVNAIRSFDTGVHERDYTKQAVLAHDDVLFDRRVVR